MAEFLNLWQLFGDSWLVALLLAALLPFCGIILVLRQQLFLSAAVGQAATLGIAFGIWTGLSPPHASSALGFALVAGALTASLSMRALSSRGSQLESRSAAVFLAGSSLSVLLASGDPHGLEAIRQLQLPSLLGVSPQDVLLAALALAATLVLALLFRDRVLLWATDPVTARVLGSNLLLLDLAVGTWIGACTGFAIHATGALYAFGLSVLPVLLVRGRCRSLQQVLVFAPLAGIAVTAVGLALAHWLDWPPGHAAVGLLVLLLPLCR